MSRKLSALMTVGAVAGLALLASVAGASPKRPAPRPEPGTGPEPAGPWPSGPLPQPTTPTRPEGCDDLLEAVAVQAGLVGRIELEIAAHREDLGEARDNVKWTASELNRLGAIHDELFALVQATATECAGLGNPPECAQEIARIQLRVGDVVKEIARIRQIDTQQKKRASDAEAAIADYEKQLSEARAELESRQIDARGC